MPGSRPQAPDIANPQDQSQPPHERAQPDHAGSGNTFGDGRTAGGGQNVRKRETLTLPSKKAKRTPG